MVYCSTIEDIKRKVLKRLRLNKNLTQSDVATKLGVTKHYISKIELGKSKIPRYRVLINLLDIYGIKPKYWEELISHEAKKENR